MKDCNGTKIKVGDVLKKVIFDYSVTIVTEDSLKELYWHGPEHFEVLDDKTTAID